MELDLPPEPKTLVEAIRHFADSVRERHAAAP